MNGLAADLGSSLNAALLLAVGRREGLWLFAAGGQDAARMAARSFFAAVLSLPAFICLHLIDWMTSGLPPHPAQDFTLDLAGYVLYWAGYAVFSHALARAIGRAAHWPRYITAWNWCNAVQYMMVTAAALPLLIGLPGLIAQAVGLVAVGWAFWLEWFATRLALDIGPVSAAVVTAIDVFAGMFLFGLLASLS
ncbi:MAG TPA: hypothetical protein VHS58_03245 [Acetobacteraceae bacterium]|nr:hypothetical protein [Acetobacteraceae bacterium]